MQKLPSGLSLLSAEGEGECLYTWIKELDLEFAISDRPPLSDQLIHPLLYHHADTLLDRKSVV